MSKEITIVLYDPLGRDEDYWRERLDDGEVVVITVEEEEV